MSDLANIRAGLAANIAVITGIQVSPYTLANPTPPCVEIVPADVEYDRTFGDGVDKLNITVRVFVGMANEISAQKRLDEYLASSGAKSIKAAIEASPALGGACDDLQVTTATGYRVYGAEGRLLGAEWNVEVLT